MAAAWKVQKPVNVAAAKAVAEARSRLESPDGPGYVELVPGATHGTIVPIAMQRWYPELRRLVAEAPER